MKHRPLIATCITATTLTLGLGVGASAASAAPASGSAPNASTSATPAAAPVIPTLEQIYDADNGNSWPGRTVSYLFKDGTPGTSVKIDNTTSGEKGTIQAVNSLGRVGVQVYILNGKVNDLVLTVAANYQGDDPVTVPLTFDDTRTAPPAPTSVSTTETGAMTTVSVSGVVADDTWLVIRNAAGRAVVGGDYDSRGKGDITLLTPDRETHYTVHIAGKYTESAGRPFVLQEGVGQAVPDAPGIDSTAVSGSRVVATVTGEAGNTVVMTDDDGKVVAVKQLGASGHAQIAVARSIVDSGADIVQQHAGISSDAVALTLTPAA